MNNLIGGTPLLEIKYKYNGTERTIYVKAEYFNLTGSIKDRMGKHIVTKAMENGSLKKGQPIIEATSGNTGIVFAGQLPIYSW